MATLSAPATLDMSGSKDLVKSHLIPIILLLVLPYITDDATTALPD